MSLAAQLQQLIQVHGYSATLAGAVFLPFTIIMGVLSRWSGGLLDRIGARLPLIVGPTITAVGFALIALSGPMAPLWGGLCGRLSSAIPPIRPVSLNSALFRPWLSRSGPAAIVAAVPNESAGHIIAFSER
jgi:hypothetical protein